MALLSRPFVSAAVLTLGASVLVAAPLLTASPAVAADWTVTTIGEFEDAVADCSSAPNTITLGADIDAPSAEVTTGCNLTIDLGVYDLLVHSVIIAPGTTLEITGPTDGTEGTLTADPRSTSGTGIRTAGATLTVTGGVVTAYGTNMESSIGGDFSMRDAGTLNVHGGIVNAYGFNGGYGTAIGGAGYGGSGGVVNVTGGSVNAESSAHYATVIGSAGGATSNPVGDAGIVTVTAGTLTAVASGFRSTAIGGGAGDPAFPSGGTGAKIVIGVDGTVTASSPYSAIGGGYRLGSADDGDFGELTVHGTLHLPSGSMIVKDSLTGPEIEVSATGRILGGPANPATGAALTGTGQISNAGIIALDPPPAMVSGNNRLVTFDTGDPAVRVFAPSFDDGYRTLPALPAGADWNTANDGTGTWFTGTSSTEGSGTTALYAASLASIDVSPDPADLTATAGQPYTFPATVIDRDGVPLSPQPTVSYTSPDCTIVGGDVFEEAGDCTIVATTTVMGFPVETVFTVHVVAGPIQGLAIAPSATTVAQGESLIFTVTGEDAFGNPVDTAAAVLTSSVPSDVISGHTVTFPHASPHTITASLDGVTAQTTVVVIADAAAPSWTDTDTATLSQTGADNGSLTALGLTGLLLLSAAGVVLARRALRKLNVTAFERTQA